MADPELLAQAIDEYADALAHHRDVLDEGFFELEEAFAYLMLVWEGDGASYFSRAWWTATGGFADLRSGLPSLMDELRDRARILREL